MKHNNSKFCLLVFSLAVLLNGFISCMSAKRFDSGTSQAAASANLPAPVSPASGKYTFIKLNGDTVRGETLRFGGGNMYGKGMEKLTYVNVGAIRVNEPEYYGYSSPEGFKAYYRMPDEMNKWVTRVKQGKMNLYNYVHVAKGDKQDDVRGEYHVYVFEKVRGDIKDLNYKNFTAALADNPKALNRFKELFPNGKVPTFDEKGNLSKLMEVVEIYNN